jgi:hypothetical protein
MLNIRGDERRIYYPVATAPGSDLLFFTNAPARARVLD